MVSLFLRVKKETDTAEPDGCSIMLLPIQVNNDYAWDTGKYKAIAEVGERINLNCVRPTIARGRSLGGLDSAGKSD